VSWAKFAPRARQSAGRSEAAATGKGNPWLGGTLGEAAAGAARTKTFLASRYKRIVRRRGKDRALVAVGNSILTITWHLLSDPAARFTDLGPDWHDRWPRCAASASSSPNSNGSPVRKSPSTTPPDPSPRNRTGTRMNPAPLTLRRVLPPAR
jgi:hypothetical protein